MNETNIKHGYSLMVREARGAILNPGVQISQSVNFGQSYRDPSVTSWVSNAPVSWAYRAAPVA